ncbi:hypothetical protein FLJC2902T_19680 [Flavobacterium limnosediminis JC2902]|uniref:Glycosyl transferase family 1 domain-containing protein n=1 Tax=Flavobacterium limnosediminis JC2902 TaxID=1341181 RepID=V6SS71_9FLAO|nr:glycosyltransferase [Flavobacterium limnosediminis]ESU27265.1 hypothetical protein FLJC2902T_19680 [Flavobacterium limnosediminis JC2902]
MREKIVFIGLVDMNEIKGDSNHFRKLTTFMQSHFDVFVISFTQSENKKYSTIHFPKNKLFRLIYWNFALFHLICKNYFFNGVNRIYFRESGLVISPYIASFLFRIKLYTEINGVTIDDLPISKKISKPLFRNIYKLSRKFVASKGYGELIHVNFNVPHSKIHKVSLGFDFLPQNYDDSNKFEEKTIVFIGNVVEYQGLDMFLEGYNLYVKNVDSAVKLLIIGDGSQKEFLKQRAEELHLENNVSFLPPMSQSELNIILKKCHLGISTFSQNRGRPQTISALKTYDYINARLPILTSDMDEMCDFIKFNNIGEVISEYVPVEYSYKISKCLKIDFIENTELIYKMNLKEWGDKFSWNTRFESIKNLIYNS